MFKDYLDTKGLCLNLICMLTYISVIFIHKFNYGQKKFHNHQQDKIAVSAPCWITRESSFSLSLYIMSDPLELLM
jgi:hypothetical protein